MGKYSLETCFVSGCCKAASIMLVGRPFCAEHGLENFERISGAEVPPACSRDVLQQVPASAEPELEDEEQLNRSTDFGALLRSGETRVPYYRLYFLNGCGHIETYESFEALDDAGAIERADLRHSVLAKELWCENRRVKQWSAPTIEQAPLARMTR